MNLREHMYMWVQYNKEKREQERLLGGSTDWMQVMDASYEWGRKTNVFPVLTLMDFSFLVWTSA